MGYVEDWMSNTVVAGQATNNDILFIQKKTMIFCNLYYDFSIYYSYLI